jgi:hypothetical protein
MIETQIDEKKTDLHHSSGEIELTIIEADDSVPTVALDRLEQDGRSDRLS